MKTSQKETAAPRISECEIREGIGLCDECSLPKWPQKYMGYGFMICLDCLAKDSVPSVSSCKNMVS